MELDTIVVGDCLDIMKDMPDGCVDLVVTDLPYGSLPNKIKWDDWLDWAQLGHQLLRVLKPLGQIFLFSNFILACHLMSTFPLRFRYEVILRKPGGMGNCYQYQPTRIHEYGLIWCKPQAIISQLTWNSEKLRTEGKPYRRPLPKRKSKTHEIPPKIVVKEMEGRQGVSVMEMISKPYMKYPERTSHPTQKSEGICQKWIGALSNYGELIFDPFIGSGTTAVGALKLGRHFYGCDISEEYVELANDRIEKERLKMAQLSFEGI